MPDPRSYGAPTGVQAPINTGRQQAKPSDPTQVSDYLKHMIQADRQHQTRKPTPGRSGATLGQTLAKGSPPVGIGGQQRRGAIDAAVDKMAK
jgi:hypothetical protein